jgi:hypothetical protein
MSLSTIDGTFYQGKPHKIEYDENIVGSDIWEVQECINDRNKVYYRLWILWNNITSKNFYVNIRKQFLSSTVDPAGLNRGLLFNYEDNSMYLPLM